MNENIINGLLIIALFGFIGVLWEIPFILNVCFGFTLSNGINYSIYLLLIIFFIMKLFTGNKNKRGDEE